MSIRYSILALLQEQPRYGYQLRAAFEERTGSVWPLNIGQVYTTLNRLERDALVRKEGDDGRGHVLFSITDAGTAEIRRWFSIAVDRGAPPRNELAIKLALAVSTAGTDAHALIQAQREISLRELQEYTQDRKDLAAEPKSDRYRQAACPGLPDLPCRGGGPLAGSLRSQAGPAVEWRQQWRDRNRPRQRDNHRIDCSAGEVLTSKH